MKVVIVLALATLFVMSACQARQPVIDDTSQQDTPAQEPMVNYQPTNLKTAYFAGGCFWCTESDFEKVEGVTEAISGFSGGHVANVTYKESNTGDTGHTECVQVHYDPSAVSYRELVEHFFRHHDPTDPDGQFVDQGSQYRPAIFYQTNEEKAIAEEVKAQVEASGRFSSPIVTEITKFDVFYQAEGYHQDYYKKNPIRYGYYRSGSGRDKFLENAWGDQDT